MSKNITIIGAGISGLSTAYMLLQKGYRVQIIAEKFSPYITSNKAAAFWFPYHARNDARAGKWSLTSYEIYKQLSNNEDTGISIHKLHKVIADNVEEPTPTWLDFMPETSWYYMPQHKLPKGMAKVYDCDVPLIETQIFLPWLANTLTQQGATFTEQKINSFAEVKGAEFIVNCTGLGSRELCLDGRLIPIRGQVALLSPQPALPIYLDNEKPCYIVPRQDATIVGGTYEENEEAEEVDEDALVRLLTNAAAVMPALTRSSYIGSWAGIRPYRDIVRLEQEAGTNIIHNYGHGGSGFTLAFGCAAQVAEMIAEALPL